MKRPPRLALAILAVLATAGLVSINQNQPLGPQVDAAKIPPPVAVTLAQSNCPLRFFPGVGASLLILSDGSLWTWGRRPVNWGRSAVPERVGTNGEWAKACAANNHCLGLQTDGTLWEWGKCGTGFSYQPLQVGSNTDWVDMAAGDLHSVALKRDGTVWGWGDNSSRQLGTFPGASSPAPIQIGADADWAAVACRQGSSTYALKKNGSLWFWGTTWMFPSNGMFTTSVPRQICADTNWITVESWGLGAAINRAGEVWVPGAPPNSNALAAVTCVRQTTNWLDGRSALAYCGTVCQYELRSDGSLWRQKRAFNQKDWHWSSSGRWRRVGNRSDWVWLGGNSTAVGLTADGTLWTWGIDPGQEPVMQFSSRIQFLIRRIRGYFGSAPSAYSWESTPPYQDAPRPLMRLSYAAKQ